MVSFLRLSMQKTCSFSPTQRDDYLKNHGQRNGLPETPVGRQGDADRHLFYPRPLSSHGPQSLMPGAFALTAGTGIQQFSSLFSLPQIILGLIPLFSFKQGV